MQNVSVPLATADLVSIPQGDGGGARARSIELSPELAACDPVARAFAEAVECGTLRSRANSLAERALAARLELTGVQRRAKVLCTCEPPQSGAVGHWFHNGYHGVTLGVVEGIVFGASSAGAPALAEAIAVHGNAQVALVSAISSEPTPVDHAPVTEKLRFGGGWHGTRTRTVLREVMQLGSDYEQTLTSLGRHTRRNMRLARRVAAANGTEFTFVTGPFAISEKRRTALAARTEPYPVSERRMRGFEAYVDLAGVPFRSTLTKDGRIISYSCGFIEDSSAYIVYQLNDREWNHSSPSLTHRAFLLEALIHRGCRELIFVHGCSGLLYHACQPLIVDHYFLMHRNPAALLGVKLLANFWPANTLGKAARSALDLLSGGAAVRRANVQA
jgi:hypothetical protein